MAERGHDYSILLMIIAFALMSSCDTLSEIQHDYHAVHRTQIMSGQ